MGLAVGAFADDQHLFEEGGLFDVAILAMGVTQAPRALTLPWSAPPGLFATNVFREINWDEIGTPEEESSDMGHCRIYALEGEIGLSRAGPEFMVETMFSSMLCERTTGIEGTVRGTLSILSSPEGQVTEAALAIRYQLEVDVETIAMDVSEEVVAVLEGKASISIQYHGD